MKNILLHFLLLGAMIISCRSPKPESSEDSSVVNCCSNNDNAYDRKLVLDNFAKTLKSLVPDYEGAEGKGFYVSEECHLIGVSMFDLTDTLNKETMLDECISFKEGHVYHF